MADDRYNRWQGLAIAQLSVAVALLSSFSVAGLGLELSLLQNDRFIPSASFQLAFLASMVFLLFAAFLSCGAVITRLLDFRLTARKVRKGKYPDYARPLIIFNSDADSYGRATWRLFWGGCLSFIIGAGLLIVAVGATYGSRWQ